MKYSVKITANNERQFEHVCYDNSLEYYITQEDAELFELGKLDKLVITVERRKKNQVKK